jgi:hypothetical protein
MNHPDPDSDVGNEKNSLSPQRIQEINERRGKNINIEDINDGGESSTKETREAQHNHFLSPRPNHNYSPTTYR